jgi:hypothetical protein
MRYLVCGAPVLQRRKVKTEVILSHCNCICMIPTMHIQEFSKHMPEGRNKTK